jgi:hypothetical protein
MFYVTPKYPDIIGKYFTLTIFILLLLKIITLFMRWEEATINILLSILFIAYAIITIHRLYKRRRPTSDATVWFWRLGMGLLIVSMIIMILNNIFNLDIEIEYFGYFTFATFILSIIFAMVYKIVPFLIWFHLSNQGYLNAPMMHDIIHPKKAKIHFWIYIAFIVLSIINIKFYTTTIDAIIGLLLTIMFGWLLYHIVGAIQKYRYVQKNEKKIEW